MLPKTAPASVDQTRAPSADRGKAASRWGKRLGVIAFLFFLIKGLAWLAVPAGIAYFASR